MKQLKVCNVKNIYETRTLGRMKVPFIGFHLITKNDFTRSETIKSCISELRNYYKESKAILVSKERNIHKLKKLINKFEFDGVQLHYKDSAVLLRSLRTEYKNRLVIFQVLSPRSECLAISPDADYVILDKSFKGGSGTEIGKDVVEKCLNHLNSNKIFLAGGINQENINNYAKLNILGFDIQSSLRSNNANQTENINYDKLLQIGRRLGYSDSPMVNGIGIDISSPSHTNENTIDYALRAQVNFIHKNVTDKQINKCTKTNNVKPFQLIDYIRLHNSHIPIQLHLFIETEDTVKQILRMLKNTSNIPTTFLHINSNNYKCFHYMLLSNQQLFYSLEIEDIVDDSFDWEICIKEQTILCSLTMNDPFYSRNLNNALKLIKCISHTPAIITLDKSFDLETIFNIYSKNKLNLITKYNLLPDMTDRLYLLKNTLYAT